MSCSCPEWTSCDLMTAFQKPPIIVRPYVPTNGADPATFGGQVRAPPRCPPYVFDITCALEWKGCVTKVTGFTQLVMGKRFDTIRTGEYPVAMAVGGVGHFISSILQIYRGSNGLFCIIKYKNRKIAITQKINFFRKFNWPLFLVKCRLIDLLERDWSWLRFIKLVNLSLKTSINLILLFCLLFV